MSLATQIGREGNVFETSASNASMVLLHPPVLSQRKLRQLLAMGEFTTAHKQLPLHKQPDDSLELATVLLFTEAAAAVRTAPSLRHLTERCPPHNTVKLKI